MSLKTELNKQKNLNCLGFVGAKPKNSVQMLLHIVNLVPNMEILTPELVGDQSEIVV